jgi:chemotaxis response regulator CheB
VSEPVPVVLVQASRRHSPDLAARLNASGELLVVGEMQDVDAAARASATRTARVVLLVADDERAPELVTSLMQRVRVPVVVLAESTKGAVAAMAAGSVEALCLDTPFPRLVESLRLMSALAVVRRFPVAERRSAPAAVASPIALIPAPASERPRLVAIGASTGGPAALVEILGVLPPDFPAAIVIAQHMPDDYDAPFARWLSEVTRLRAKVSDDGEPVQVGTVYIPRGGCDLVLGPSGVLQNVVPRRKGPVPSADRLLESAAGLEGFSLFGIVLTGMGRDGMVGLKAMRVAGAATVAQDQASSVVGSMPEAALANGGAHVALPPPHIGLQLLAWGTSPGLPD